MVQKKNPLNLNPLQLKTLTLLQELGTGQPEDAQGGVMVSNLPRPHGDHFHIGGAVAMTRDASGLGNEAVWKALERKGLIRSMFPDAAVITPAGRDYDTGMREKILVRSHH